RLCGHPRGGGGLRRLPKASRRSDPLEPRDVGGLLHLVDRSSIDPLLTGNEVSGQRKRDEERPTRANSGRIASGGGGGNGNGGHGANGITRRNRATETERKPRPPFNLRCS